MNSEIGKNIHHLLQRKYGIIGDSEPMQESIRKLMQTAPTDLTVLITGETGTGKELFANAIHGLSSRSKNPFVSVNCGAIPETLLESELFGHEKGAFTGADDRRKGFFEEAHHGTIFLDEIGEMPVGTQVKLLRVLESGEFSRLGSSAIHEVDTRIIAATNRDLLQEVENGNFRRDLYYRLKTVQIELPPLREHPHDIPQLVDYFTDQVSKKLSVEFKGISDDAIRTLKGLPWHGNVRELRNMIETLVTIEQGEYITTELLSKYIPRALPEHKDEEPYHERSLMRLKKEEEESGKFELGLIFRTLLEIKNEISEMNQSLANNTLRINELSEGLDQIQIQTVEEIKENGGGDFLPENLNLAEMEKRHIRAALDKYEGNRRLASKALGISERTLYRKISDYGLNDL